VVDARAVAVDAETRKAYVVEHATLPLSLRAVSLDEATDLVVTTMTDELDGDVTAATVDAAGGAADLSLREAVTIAANRPGPDVVTFDPVLCAATSPCHIALDTDTFGTIAVTGAGTAISGRNRGVILTSLAYNSGFFVVQANDVTVTHLTFEGIFSAVSVQHAGNVAILDNNLMMGSTGSSAAISGNDAPALQVVGNRVRGGTIGLSVANTTNDVLIAQNDVAVTQDGLRLTNITGVTVRDNLLAPNQGSVVMNAVRNSSIVANRLRSLESCLSFSAGSDGNVVTDNQLGPCGGATVAAVDFRSTSRDNTLSRNLFYGTGAILSLVSIAAGCQRDITPPVITQASALVTGTATAGAGSTIEVFADPGAFASTSLGATEVAAGGAWSLTPEVQLAPGQFVTATVTSSSGNTSAFSLPVVVP
jgi:hypothetical protein